MTSRRVWAVFATFAMLFCAAAPSLVRSTPPLESYRDLLGGEIEQKATIIFDERYDSRHDPSGPVTPSQISHLKDFIGNIEMREAAPFTELQQPPEWYEDYEDFCEVGYYTAEHTFSRRSPFRGQTIFPDTWADVIYRCSEVNVEFWDLSELYEGWERTKRVETDHLGWEWTLYSMNDGMEWAAEMDHDLNEFVVVVPYMPDAPEHYSYYFLEEDYTEEKGWGAYHYNLMLQEWPDDLVDETAPKPHNLPIWLHYAALYSEWNPDEGRWELAPSFTNSWGGYTNIPVWFTDQTGEESDFIGDFESDWERIWRSSFNRPSLPFWHSEKIEVRTAIIDLRDWEDGAPEYEEGDVIDWDLCMDSLREINPYATIAHTKWYVPIDEEQKEALIANYINKAPYPVKADLKILGTDGEWKSYHIDWQYYVDIGVQPGIANYLVNEFDEFYEGYWGPNNAPFGKPYHETGEAWIIPCLYILTPYKRFDGKVGGWMLDARKQRSVGLLGEGEKPTGLASHLLTVGPDFIGWSIAYGLWWEAFLTDFAYYSVPHSPTDLGMIGTMRWLIDPGAVRPSLMHRLIGFESSWGDIQPWGVGFPFWTLESLTDPMAMEMGKAESSYQNWETLQHNFGYKHETTVIFNQQYLAMENCGPADESCQWDQRVWTTREDLESTCDWTDEERTGALYWTEPGSRDVHTICAGTYMTHKLSAGTLNMVQRMWGRREVMALYDQIDKVLMSDRSDQNVRLAIEHYEKACDLQLGWNYLEAYEEAKRGLERLDNYWTERGKPDVLYTDWDAVDPFEPEKDWGLKRAPLLKAELELISDFGGLGIMLTNLLSPLPALIKILFDKIRGLSSNILGL